MENNIKTILRERGVTQTWLSRQVGISCSYLSLIISNKRDPDLELAVKISKFLGVPLQRVFPQHRTDKATGTISRVLLIDDDRNVCEILDMLLRTDGYNVKTAHDGFDAGFQATIFKPELIVLDILLDGLDGISVCAKLRAQRPELKILGISSSHNAELKDRMMKAGANAFLQKPFDYGDLKKVIHELEARAAAV